MNAKITDIHTSLNHRNEPIASIHLRLKLDSETQKDAMKHLYDLINAGVIVDIQEDNMAEKHHPSNLS